MRSTKMTFSTTLPCAVLLTTALFSTPTLASDQSSAQPKALETYISHLPEPQQRKVAVYTDMLLDHQRQNLSLIRTVRILTTHYPQDVNAILVSAYRQQPDQIVAISKAVIHSEPALTSDVLDTAFAVSRDNCAELVAMAIKAEPAYIDDIVAVAVQHRPADLNEIVRIAITAEPELSGSVVRTAAMNSPESFFDAIITTVKNIPASTKDMFRAVKDFLSGASPETDVPKGAPEQWQQFIVQAKAQGVTKEEMKWFEDHGYITHEQLAVVYDNNN